MTGQIIFDPLIPWQLLAVVAIIAVAGVVLAAARGLSGWALRGIAALVVLGTLSGPSYQQEDRAPLSDIVLILEDESASQTLSDRPAQTTNAADALADRITAREGTEVRRITVPDGEGDAGTQLMTTLSKALAEEPRGRVAGIIAFSDGQVHDAELPLDLPAPMHLLLSGKSTDWDRRLSIPQRAGLCHHRRTGDPDPARRRHGCCATGRRARAAGNFNRRRLRRSSFRSRWGKTSNCRSPCPTAAAT